MSCRKWEIQILRREEGTLDEESEAALARHLERCSRCRAQAHRFSHIETLFLESQKPSVPLFLKERIVSSVVEEMRQDCLRGPLSRFIGSRALFRHAIAGAALVAGIGLGALAGWNLAQSITTDLICPSYDLLFLAGVEGRESGSSLDFIWTDNDVGDGR